MAKLTMKQEKFVEAFMISGNATQAALEAGYSKKTAKQAGAENLSKPYLAAEIKRRTEELQNEKVDTQQDIVEYLSAVRRGQVMETIVTPSGMKVQVPAKISDRNKAAELMGKRYAMWTENRNINATVGPVKIIDDVPDEDPPVKVEGFKVSDDDG